VGTKAHHPASLPPISEYYFSRNVEFFNRIADKPTFAMGTAISSLRILPQADP
jgi:hypothetical protein